MQPHLSQGFGFKSAKTATFSNLVTNLNLLWILCGEIFPPHAKFPIAWMSIELSGFRPVIIKKKSQNNGKCGTCRKIQYCWSPV